MSYEVSDEYLGQNVLGAMSAVMWSLTGHPPTGLNDEDYEHYDAGLISESTEARTPGSKWCGTAAVRAAAEANGFTSDSHPELIFENWLGPDTRHSGFIEGDDDLVPMELDGSYAALVRGSAGTLTFIVFHVENSCEQGTFSLYNLRLEYLNRVDCYSLAPTSEEDPGFFIEDLDLTIEADCDYFEMKFVDRVDVRYLRPDIAEALQDLTGLFAGEMLRLAAARNKDKSILEIAGEVS